MSTDPIEDLERIVGTLRADRDRREARINKAADGIREVAGLVREDIAALNLAERRLDSVREVVDGFLSEYGDSEIPMFKVAQDLANSIRKRLDGKLDDL